MSAGVVVVGAGPAGLSAAAELRRLGAGPVLVADREPEPGGVPRHSWHTGYGLRDLRRVMTGPAYARALVSAAAGGGRGAAGGHHGDRLDDRAGRHARGHPDQRRPASRRCAAAAVLLATGCRERPRTARLVPGDRPAGVMTTGELQQRVYLGGERLAGRALVVGAEHVSFSAALTLAHAGADVVALVTEHERQQSYAAFRFGAAVRWRVPVWTSSAVRRIAGRGRLEGVEVADVRTGAARFVPCELVVFTGDWIPDHELARLAGLAMDPGTRGPVVDTRWRRRWRACSRPATWCTRPRPRTSPRCPAGTPPGTSPAFLGGRAPRRRGSGTAAGRSPVPVLVEPPLRWISPNAIGSAAPPPLGRFVLRSAVFRRGARLEVRQDGRLLARSRPVRLIPERPVHLGAAWLARVDPAGGPVRVVTGT